MQFKDKFGRLRIFTDGTIVPKSDLMSLFQKHSDFFGLEIDDYGPDASQKVPEIMDMLSKQNLPLCINRYHGDRQHYNGWVDYGSPEYGRGYSESQLRDVFLNCHSGQYKCVTVSDGNISNCGWTMFGVEGKLFPDSDKVARHDLVPLLDPALSDEEKCRRIADFGKVPLLACQYCNGFDIEKSTRYSAGEQI